MNMVREELKTPEIHGFKVALSPEQLLHLDATTLRIEAECLFFDYLVEAGIVVDEADYIQNFRAIFNVFIQGDLAPIVQSNHLTARYEEELNKLHSASMRSPHAMELYAHCQTRMLAYLIKIGRLIGKDFSEVELQYEELGFAEVFALMSTGGLTLEDHNFHAKRNPILTAFPDSGLRISSPAESAVPTTAFGTRLRAASVI